MLKYTLNDICGKIVHRQLRRIHVPEQISAELVNKVSMIHVFVNYNVGKDKHYWANDGRREPLFLFFYSLRDYLRQFIAIDKRAVL